MQIWNQQIKQKGDTEKEEEFYGDSPMTMDASSHFSTKGFK